MIERITVVKFRIDNGGGNGVGCFEVNISADTAKLTNAIVARFRKCGDFVRECKVKPRLRPEWVVVRERSSVF